MSFELPKSINELMQSRVALIIGTAALTTAVLCAYNVMVNADGQTLLVTATKNLMSVF